MSLVIIGEAATKVMERYPVFVEQRPEIPWRNMRGMPHRIAHGYFDIDLEVVLNTHPAGGPSGVAGVPAFGS